MFFSRKQVQSLTQAGYFKFSWCFLGPGWKERAPRGPRGEGMGSKKLENSFNFSAGESQNKAQMRLPSSSRTFNAPETGVSCKNGGNAEDDVGISAFGEFLIGWMDGSDC